MAESEEAPNHLANVTSTDIVRHIDAVVDKESSCTDEELEQPSDTEEHHNNTEVVVANLNVSELNTSSRGKIKTALSWVRKESLELFKLGLPVVMTLLFQYLLLFISLLFVGHIPNEEDNSLNYAAAGLGSSFVNVTGYSVAQGFSTAVDTLCSQAYGYKNYKRVGVVLQRGILMVFLLLFPIWAIWLNTETLLLLVRQDPCVARLTAFFTQIQTMALPCILVYVILQHYLNAQSIVWQFVVIGFLTNCFSVILHTILIYGAGMGYRGAVVALVLSNSLPPLLAVGYLRLRGLHKLTWHGVSWQSLEEWLPFLKLAIPGMLMNCLEWWSAEVITFIAGAISETELAATSIWFQIMVILYMLPIGTSVATSVRVGNALGRGDPVAAKRISFVATAMAFCFAVLVATVLLLARNHIGSIFISGNDEVVARVGTLMFVAAAMVLSDFMQVVMTGSLKGSGRQYIGAAIVFVGYYIIGLPLGILLALKFDLGAVGLWIGMTCGNYFHSCVLIILLIFSKWEKLSQKAIKLAQSGEKPTTTEQSNAENNIEFELDVIKEKECMEQCEDLDPFDNGVLLDSSSDEDHLLPPDDNEPELQLGSIEEDSDKETLLNIKTITRTKGLWRTRIKNLVVKGSLFVCGLALLVAGGVGSVFHPYVPEDEYSNCTANFTEYMYISTINSTAPL